MALITCFIASYILIAWGIYYGFRNADRRWYFHPRSECFLLAFSWPFWVPLAGVCMIRTKLGPARLIVVKSLEP